VKTIAVLGCGPAGLLAAHACRLNEQPFAIFSNPVKSNLGGAQFLHKSILQLTKRTPDTMITIEAHGDAEEYRRKVYGADPTVPFVSFPSERITRQPAWNLVRTYDMLWEMYKDGINEAEISPQWVRTHKDEFSFVFNTVPMPHLCAARAGLVNEVHHFSVQNIVVHPDALINLDDNVIRYDGTKDHGWYRMSRLFGQGGTEWSDLCAKPPISPLISARKPIHTSCNCFSDVIRLGRHGTWKKGVLTHDAFFDTMKVLMEAAA
jgi:hypothetical protein